jgi:hypothetical protein
MPINPDDVCLTVTCRHPGPIEPTGEAMTDQEQIEEVLHRAAVPIAIEIDNMLSRLPADADPIEVANDLIVEWAACCGCPEFIALFADAFAARQAMTEWASTSKPAAGHVMLASAAMARTDRHMTACKRRTHRRAS